MKKISSVISLSVLVILLLVGCVSSSSNLVKSGDDNDWVKYYTSKDGTIWLYKKVSSEKKDEKYIVQVWNKVMYSTKGKDFYKQQWTKDGYSTEGWDKLSGERFLYEIDCNEYKRRTLYVIVYDTDGKILFENDYDVNIWDSITPNSVKEILLKRVCN